MKKILFALLCLPALARAEFWTGNDLYSNMTGTDVMSKMHALGYVMGVYDTGVTLAFCPPTERGITAGQVNDIVRLYLERNPAQRNKTGDRVVLDALIKTWPCPTNKTPGRAT